MKTENIRNVAIVAHVDHGKTSLIDQLLKGTEALDRKESTQTLLMDSNEQEKERGITILSKVTAIHWKQHRINIIDTPGHADFSGEVERVLGMADAVALLIDAVDGPMPQTRFVAERAIKKGLMPIVVINKIDRHEADPDNALNNVFDLLVTLGANDTQLDFPVIYCSARYGYAYSEGGIHTEPGNMEPLLDALVECVKAPASSICRSLKLQITQLDFCDYQGLIGIGRISDGKICSGQRVSISDTEGNIRFAQVRDIFHHVGLAKVKIDEGIAGDIIAVTGIGNIRISDVIGHSDTPVFMPKLEIDKPTVSVRIGVNNSPKANSEGHALQSRELGHRLFKETMYNVSLNVKSTRDPDIFEVSGRGELHLGVLIEDMRREGFEFVVSRPQIIMDEFNDKYEPYENVVIDCEPSFCGHVIKELADRRIIIESHEALSNGHSRMVFCGPKRGTLGIRHTLLSLTEGTASIHKEYAGMKVKINGLLGHRTRGVMVSNGGGKALIHSLSQLQSRGRLMIQHGDMVYAGQIIGETSTNSDMWVNCRQGKNLVPMWRNVSDKNYAMKEIKKLSLEEALTWINNDEWIEVTPSSIRLKKRSCTVS
ncbi:GTP-binding protein [Aeromonas sp. MdU4]|uniref:GTP-binding protein n=1 Tax=Aeromonas sp. MdU4 TaxID=3342819 RepID=UPI0035BAB4AA